MLKTLKFIIVEEFKKIAKIFLFELNFPLLCGTLKWMYDWYNRDGTYSIVIYFSLNPQNNKKNPWNQESL